MPIAYNRLGLNENSNLVLNHQSLDPYNYCPVPFLDFASRQFVMVKKCQNGDLYEGYFLDGQANGFGRLISSNLTVIYGEFKEDSLDGFCTILFQNGTKYEGLAQYNERHGYGK